MAYAASCCPRVALYPCQAMGRAVVLVALAGERREAVTAQAPLTERLQARANATDSPCRSPCVALLREAAAALESYRAELRKEALAAMIPAIKSEGEQYERERAEAAEARAEKYREALEFYAVEDNYRWSEGPPVKRGVIQAEDKGQRAREALGGPAEDRWVFVEGDARCGAVHPETRAVCLLPRGHEGSHRNTQGYWMPRDGEAHEEALGGPDEGDTADRPEDLPVPANADKRYEELDGG